MFLIKNSLLIILSVNLGFISSFSRSWSVFVKISPTERLWQQIERFYQKIWLHIVISSFFISSVKLVSRCEVVLKIDTLSIFDYLLSLKINIGPLRFLLRNFWPRMTFFTPKTFFVQERHFERVFANIRNRSNFDFYNLERFLT